MLITNHLKSLAMTSVWGQRGFYVVISPFWEDENIEIDDLLNFLHNIVGNALMSVVPNPDGSSWLVKINDKKLAKLLTLYDKLSTKDYDEIQIKIVEHYGLNQAERYYVSDYDYHPITE